jgi:ABC-type sugar transport system permease subunit
LQFKFAVFAILICALVLSCTATYISAAPSLSLSWYKDNGYGMGSDIGGYFTVNTNVSPDVVYVEFYVDDELQLNDTVAPFSWSLNTGNFTDGTHTIKAVAYDSIGETAIAEAQRNFVEYSMNFLIIVFVIVVVVLAVSLVAALVWAKKKEAKRKS